MVAYNEPKPKTVRPAESGFGRAEDGIPRPAVNISQSTAGSGGTLAIVIAIVLVAVAAYFLSTTNWSGTTVAPSVTQNNITVPAPAASTTAPATPPTAVAITPDPATPAAVDKTTPVTPDATKPAQ